MSNEPKQDGEPFDRGVIERLITMLRVWAEHQLIQAPRDIELSSEMQALLDAYDRLAAESRVQAEQPPQPAPATAAEQALLDAYDRLAAESKAQAEQPPQPAPATAAELDSLRSSLAILTCRVAALESAQIRGPSVPASPWQPYHPPFGPLITYGTRTSDKIEERA